MKHKQTMKNKISVMLVEDNLEYREVISLALEDAPGIELTSKFGTAEIALRKAQNITSIEEPDIILLDLNLPGMSGLEAIPWFKQYTPNAQIIVLTQSNEEADVLTAISSGAAGYLLKSATIQCLKDSIQTVVDGGSTLDPGVARFIIRTLRNQPPKTFEKNCLTPRELEILSLTGEGLSKKEVADRLHISPNTVAVHSAHIHEKLNVPNAPAAVSKAYRLGLFPPD